MGDLAAVASIPIHDHLLLLCLHRMPSLGLYISSRLWWDLLTGRVTALYNEWCDSTEE